MRQRLIKIKDCPVGPLAVLVTVVRPDATTVADTENPAWYRGEPARNELENAEPVVMTVPLPTSGDREYAQMRARMIAAAIPAEARDNYRVKVVSAVTA